jgi:NodT family efflux transporter outer membrane factor (OMF) lipoprotein
MRPLPKSFARQNRRFYCHFLLRLLTYPTQVGSSTQPAALKTGKKIVNFFGQSTYAIVSLMKRIAALTLFFLAGCMVGPSYHEPENCVTDQWSSPSEATICDPLIEWWTVFNDCLLNQYMATAAECNKNLLVAEANILQARALRQVSASALFPHIGADFNAAKFEFSKNGLIFGPVSADKSPKPTSLFSAFFDASWEIDLFGKTRWSIQAANATIDSNIEQRNSVLITIMAEIARNYIELRSHQKQEQLVELNIELLEQQTAIVQKQLEFGYVSMLNYQMIEAQLAAAKAALPDIKAQIYQNIYAISVLIGSEPEKLLDELLEPKALPKPPELIAVGLRSDLVRRRPDIRHAERELATATANTGVAIAAFFPSIFLGGLEGLQSLHWDKLFKGSSNIWGGGGNAFLPIFEGGQQVGNLQVNQAETEAAYQTYQQTVLQALEEAEGALVAYTQELQAAREYKDSTEHYRNLVNLALHRFEKGLTNRIDYLTSQEQLVSSEQSQLNSDTLALIDLIALYKSLGGGWECVD